MTPGDGKRRFGRNLRQRVLVAVLFIPLFLWLSYLGGIAFFLYVELLILLGIREYFAMVGSRGYPLHRWTGMIGALGCGALMFFRSGNTGEPLFLIAFIIPLLLLLKWLFSGKDRSSLASVGLSLLGVIYVGFFFSHQIILRERPGSAGGSDIVGWYYLLFPYLVVWTSDTSAYFVGKLMGKHRLAPMTSPGKSVEGAIGGFVVSVAVALVYQGAVHEHIARRDALILGPLVAIVCQLGDMIESRMKREFGMKDSSSLIPGHGGILDRYDGILLAVPLSSYYFLWIGPLLPF